MDPRERVIRKTGLLSCQIQTEDRLVRKPVDHVRPRVAATWPRVAVVLPRVADVRLVGGSRSA